MISGTTITPGRAAIVLFSDPYLEFNQGVAVNRECTPDASAESDFRGLAAGIQVGNTSDFVARRWVAQEVIAGIGYYPYDGIQTALSDLEAGNIGLVYQAVSSHLVADQEPS